MTTGYDGSIRIDSRIDTSGFNTGIKSMEGMVRNLAVVIGTVLGVKAFSSVLKLSAEFQRLELAARAVGSMFGYTASEVTEITDALIRSGIQTDVANKSFINFAREGLDTNLLPLLARGAQDLNVFAEAGETSSDVMDRLMNGILTLNPIILRRAGVAVDLFQAYREYADSQGMTVPDMTILQKREAALIAVTQKLTGVTGLYALSQRTAAGQLASHTRIMNEFKGALGRPFLQAFYELIKAWNLIVKAWTAAISPGGRLYQTMLNIAAVARILVSIITWLANLFAKLFGGSVNVSKDTEEALANVGNAAQDAADGQDALGKATGKAGKAAKGALAPFDELNVLQQDSAASAATGSGVGKGVIFPEILGFDQTVSDLEGLQERVDEMKDWFGIAFAPLIDSLVRLEEASRPLRATLWEGIVWFFDNVLAPLGMWTANELLPAFFDLLGSASIVLNEALVALQPIAQWLWDNFLAPLAAWTGGAIIEILGFLNEQLLKLGEWISEHQEGFQWIVVILGGMAIAFALVSSAVAIFSGVLGVAAAVLTGFSAAVAFLASPIGIVILAIGALIAILAFLITNWEDVKVVAENVWNGIVAIWSKAWKWFDENVIQPVTEGFQAAWDAIAEGFGAAWESAVTLLKSAVNKIIDLVNSLITSVVNGINAVINAMNGIKVTIPSWVPGFGGNTFGLNLQKVSAPQIPKLATGAVIPPNSEFAAILGDQRSGRNIEAPEALIRQIMQEELGRIEADIQIGFGGSMGQLVRQLKPMIEKENVRLGRSMVRSIS